MINFANLSIFIIYTVIVSVLIVSYIKEKNAHKKVFALLVQSIIDKEELLKNFQEFVNDQSVQAVQETDGFVKFISESREWAFGYIEDVQKAIQVLADTPRSNRAEYNEAYKKLIAFLPEQTKEN
jgi:hypothetical protein